MSLRRELAVVWGVCDPEGGGAGLYQNALEGAGKVEGPPLSWVEFQQVLF